MDKGFVKKELVNIAKMQDVFDILSKDGIPMTLKDGVYRHKEHNSMVITPNKGFYWFSQGFGSRNPIDYYVKVENMDFVDAVYRVLDVMNYDYSKKNIVVTRQESSKSMGEILPREFELPKESLEKKHVYTYLTKTRKIDAAIVKDLMEKGFIYQSEEHNNAVFIGKDYDGNTVSAFKRSTRTNLSENSWKSGDVLGSQKEYRLRIENKNNKTVNVFEAEIDMLSYITLQPEIARNENYIALGGTSDKALIKFLENRDITHINICTDNDIEGKRCAKRVFEALGDKYTITRELPKLKDFNEVLVNGLEYSRERLEVLSFEEETTNMSIKEKISFIEDIFSNMYQSLNVPFDYPEEKQFINIEQEAIINMNSKKNYVYKDRLETYRGSKNKLNIGVEMNLINFLKTSNYEHSLNETKPTQNKIHRNTKNWHYFNKKVLIDDQIFKVNIDVREDFKNNTYLHKVRLLDISSEYELDSSWIKNEDKKKRLVPVQTSTKASVGIRVGQLPSHVSNDIPCELESQEPQEKKSIISFSKGNEEEFEL